MVRDTACAEKAWCLNSNGKRQRLLEGVNQLNGTIKSQLVKLCSTSFKLCTVLNFFAMAPLFTFWSTNSTTD